MARWYLTSSEVADRAAQILCERAELREAGRVTVSNCHGASYFKRVVTTDTFFRAADDQWICVAGTMLYGGHLGIEALRACFDDFREGGAATVQSNAIGHFGMAIRCGSELSIFTDPMGSLNLYYATAGSFWFVSNSLSLCAGSLPNRRIEPTKLLIQALQSTLPGEDTFYAGIKRLFGSQLITVEMSSGSFSVRPLRPPERNLNWKLPCIEEAVEQYKQEVRSVFQPMRSRGSVALMGTGGLDSRTVLAGLLDSQISPKILYGIGNSRLTDYLPDDLAVSKQLASLFDLSFHQLDWSGTQPYSEEKLESYFRKYGFRSEIYGASDHFLKFFQNGISPYPDLFLGGYGPAFTNSKPWELEKASFTMDELIADAMRFHGCKVEESHCIADVAAYRAAFAVEVRTALRCAGIDFPETGASLDAFIRAKLFMYIRPESRFANFANEFGNYIAPFLTKRLYDPLIQVPLPFRARDEFQIRLIHALAPGLSEVPLYSGWGQAHIDRSTFRLVRNPVPTPRSLMRRAIGKILPSRTKQVLKGILGWCMARTKPATREPESDRTSAIVEVYSRAILNDPVGRESLKCASEFTPKELSRILQYLVGVKSLGYSE